MSDISRPRSLPLHLQPPVAILLTILVDRLGAKEGTALFSVLKENTPSWRQYAEDLYSKYLKNGVRALLEEAEAVIAMRDAE